MNTIQREQGYHSRIYVEIQLLLVYNGDQKRLAASLNKALIPCLICEPIDLQENERNCEVDNAMESQEQCTLNKINLRQI